MLMWQDPDQRGRSSYQHVIAHDNEKVSNMGKHRRLCYWVQMDIFRTKCTALHLRSNGFKREKEAGEEERFPKDQIESRQSKTKSCKPDGHEFPCQSHRPESAISKCNSTFDVQSIFTSRFFIVLKIRLTAERVSLILNNICLFSTGGKRLTSTSW